MSEGQVRFEREGVVGRILFDNPSAYNALSWPMWRELGRLCREIAADRSIRVVTLRGAGGKAFVSGTDIEGFRAFEGGERGVTYEQEMDSYVGALEALPQPTIAIVEGYAVGGGLALSFASDFRIAAEGAKFGSPLARTIGNCLSARGYARLLTHIGPAQAKRMLLLGELVSAEELLGLGLVNRVVARDQLDATAAQMCETLAGHAPLSMEASKTALSRAMAHSLPEIDDLIRRVYGSDDFRSGVESFLAKRKPAWTGQ